MTYNVAIAADNDADNTVDSEIIADLDLDHPVSFFLSADAGSGKTRSLVIALDRIREKSGKRLRLYGQRVGVITYTNAACDVIKSGSSPKTVISFPLATEDARSSDRSQP